MERPIYSREVNSPKANVNIAKLDGESKNLSKNSVVPAEYEHCQRGLMWY